MEEPSRSIDYVAICKAELEKLQNAYVGELERLVGIIVDIKLYEQDEAQRKVKIEAILDEIVVLENNSDIQVYQLLYDLQNDLEREKKDVAVVNELREAYHVIKEEKKSEYMSQL